MNSPSLEIERAIESGATIVRPRGEIDMNTSPLFRSELLTLATEKTEKVIVDLSGVPHMDSSGLATLVEFRQRMDQDKGGRIILAGLQPTVRGVFELARLDRFFTIAKSVDDARRA